MPPTLASGWEAPRLSALAKYPALSVGYVIFTFVLMVVDQLTKHALSHKFSLFPGAPLEFDLNRLSFYLLFHTDLLHWGLNMLGLFTALGKFEETHGTVHTGITLNLITVVTGLQYCLVGLLFYPDENVIGSSGIVFTFYTYYAYKEHQITPILHTFTFHNREYTIKTIYSPFIFLAVSYVIFPGSSFWGHIFAISTGFLLAMGYINVLYPPSKVVLFIERKVARAINLLDGVVTFYKESEIADVRGLSYTSIFAKSDSPVAATFAQETRVLGA